jgi:hypothetical protein
MANYAAPGVYIEEISTFPPAIAAVETALPAFVGYTEFRRDAGGVDLPANSVQRIGSLIEFEQRYGPGRAPTVDTVELDENGGFLRAGITQRFYLYDALRMFYANGGGDCFIVSVGTAVSGLSAPSAGDFEDGIDALETWDEPTLILIPDAGGLDTDPGAPNTADPIHALVDRILLQSSTLGDRFGVFSVPDTDPQGSKFRNNTGIAGLKYGAAYTPWLTATLAKPIYADDLSGTTFSRRGAGAGLSLQDVLTDTTAGRINAVASAAGDPIARTEAEMALRSESGIYTNILRGLNGTPVDIPPGGAVVGAYAYTDRTRGVWKAPANVSISGVLGPARVFSQSELAALNVDVTAGKSINAIRAFAGRGTLIYGARTLAGNDGEYRYVSVRRLMNMLEESTKKAAAQFVFEPNDANTWVRVRGMIENFLTLLWQDGALQGAKADHAFRVAIGLGETMSAQDVIDGRMIVEIAVAPVRPAEFIVLRFMQHLPNS